MKDGVHAIAVRFGAPRAPATKVSMRFGPLDAGLFFSPMEVLNAPAW